MSRKASCRDNAPMESFFGTLKTELVHQREYPDRDAARRDLFAYIEGYYNRQRIHSVIGYITPEQQRRYPHNPVSTLPGEGHMRDGPKQGQGDLQRAGAAGATAEWSAQGTC